MIRYAKIKRNNPREIVLLMGKGCSWKKCTFCDYHNDFSLDLSANYELNKKELAKITGVYGVLEVINSGSFIDLDEKTLSTIKEICFSQKIHTLHFESHWSHRKAIPALRQFFEGISIKVKTGVETFDYDMREKVLHKGLTEKDPAVIASFFQECCLLFGLPGQTLTSMMSDIVTGLTYFERICINVMQQNTSSISPSPKVVEVFKKQILPIFQESPRVDILLENTDFGVGGE